jgi:hypothetical protein
MTKLANSIQKNTGYFGLLFFLFFFASTSIQIVLK